MEETDMRTTVPTAWPTGAPSIGDRARSSRRVTERDIALFTEISGDRNPIHYDAELAAATRFGGIVVQGGVTSALLNALVAEDLPGPGTVFLELNLRFLAPVRPGDTITAEAEVTGVRTDKPITELAVAVARDDDVRALEGPAVCYTMLLVA
jgi:acyl dehydratase